MQGKKQFTDQVVTHFRLSERVPAHNLYRRLDELQDLHFLYDMKPRRISTAIRASLPSIQWYSLS
ncbi:hypothetical protein SAMN00120144_2142 [Hymenobacter roseosalivarius DSM 11622]|uniref:Uncharacterized protein n=1 Tax=Hymenobacter roseosalivarius DSM 11622 TaxID=645990 RepID=A0A1W1VG76_9BACT|nr:hypothetical protein SAMN00120144_2142 [Hymenobacter roseosalivarius DSM 11622]